MTVFEGPLSYTFIQVGEGTTTRTVRCHCNHLTSFGSQFFVPPNTIDFASVYADVAGALEDNFAVLVSLCVLGGAYLLLVVWARIMDSRDVRKVRIIGSMVSYEYNALRGCL